ncbi:MAG: hypothetical protein HYV07_26410 [Deltaproteobacteria bacterium]|nr:hypothetical protein [Deltaproteobacteria bacterium]
MTRRIALLLLALAVPACERVDRLMDPAGYDLRRARAFYAAQPEYLRPIPASPPPAGLQDLRASTCGACHREIYEEWKISTHARAYLDDPQFMAELAKSSKPELDVTWMCLNCHTPTESQLERLVVSTNAGVEKPEYVRNPDFDPALRAEAITCATCHVRDGKVLGPTGSATAPHPVEKDESLLRSDVCTRCHQAKAEFVHIALACVFDTGAEHAKGPDRDKTCQTCHMPELERPMAPGSPPRKTRRHWLGGSLIPKTAQFEADMKLMRPHYPDGLVVTPTHPPTHARPGDILDLSFDVENRNAGHSLPTGDPERFFLVTLSARTGTTVVYERTERIGALYQWSPVVKKLADNRLAPRERRTIEATFAAPVAPKVEITLRATKHRISEDNLAYHALEGKSVDAITTFERAFDIVLDAQR